MSVSWESVFSNFAAILSEGSKWLQSLAPLINIPSFDPDTPSFDMAPGILPPHIESEISSLNEQLENGTFASFVPSMFFTGLTQLVREWTDKEPILVTISNDKVKICRCILKNENDTIAIDCTYFPMLHDEKGKYSLAVRKSSLAFGME